MIDGVPITGEGLTIGGLYLMLLLLMFFERVVPIGRVRSEEKRTEYWRDAAEKKQETVDVQAETIKLLAEETAASFTKVMTTLQDQARKGEDNEKT